MLHQLTREAVGPETIFTLAKGNLQADFLRRVPILPKEVESVFEDLTVQDQYFGLGKLPERVKDT